MLKKKNYDLRKKFLNQINYFKELYRRNLSRKIFELSN